MKLRVVLLTGVFLLLGALPASAHPLGNFTVNTYDGLRVQPDRLFVDHVLDMAEIPTYQERRAIDRNRDGVLAPAEVTAYAATSCARAAQDVRATVGGRELTFGAAASSVAFPPGAGGLPTLRVTCSLRSNAFDTGTHRLTFEAPAFTGRIGWHEITVVGDRATLENSDAPATSVSARLTRYPQDLLRSPLDVRRASFTARPGGAAAPATTDARGTQARGLDRITRAFTSLVAAHRASIPFALLAIVIAIGLGALHALAPGHGKTVMAAYVTGMRGTKRQTLLIGATVTATHTAGVLAIGLALSLSTSLAPERLYPWLALASGVLLVCIGAGMLRMRLRARAHGHTHDAIVGRRGLLAMGFAGGLVPSPSALVVLLGAIALRRVWFGIVLVLAYGAGMAATLIGAGLLLLRARTGVERRWLTNGRIARMIPTGAAGLLVVLGLVVAMRAAVQL